MQLSCVSESRGCANPDRLAAASFHAPRRPAVSRGVRAVQWLPLFGSLGTYALELVDSMQGYYTYVES